MNFVKSGFAVLLLTMLVSSQAFAYGYCSFVFARAPIPEIKYENTLAQTLVKKSNDPSKPNYDYEAESKKYQLYTIDPLLKTRELQKSQAKDVLQGDEETSALVSAFSTMQETFLSNRTIELDSFPSQMLRLVDYDAYKKYREKDPQKSTMGIYGTDTMRAWKDADDYLAGIPIGKFELSADLIKNVAALAARDISPLGVSIPRITPESGKFKLLPNSGRAALKEPLTEEQYQNLKNNEWISGFLEVPWSKPGERRGVIVYALPHTVGKKLEKLVEWYNSNKNSMDPIRLATEFQRNFISIHPLVDGNGRTSRLLMDRILLEHGLPPALILDHNMDLYSNIDDYEKAVRIGVADSINLIKQEFYNFQAGSRLQIGLSDIMNSDAGNVKWTDEAAVKKFTDLQTYKFKVGDRIFQLHYDGFIYDQYGVPHEYHDGRFYPIADRMTELYDFGGDIESFKVRHLRYGNWNRLTQKQEILGQSFTTENHRHFSELKKQIFANHLRIVEKIKEGQIATDGLTTEPVTTIKTANENADIYIYPWQEEQFANALAPRNEAPEQALAPFYQSDTTYATLLRNGQEPSVALTVAQYEHVDLLLHDYEKAAKNFSKLRKALQTQRELIHKIAHEKVTNEIAELNKLSPSDRELAEKDFRFQLLKTYLSISKLRFNTLAEAQAAGADKYVPLLRIANEANTAVGFVPVMTYRSLLSKVPYFKRMIDWAENLQKDVGTYGAEFVLTKKVNALPIPKALKAKLLAKVKKDGNEIYQGINTFINDMKVIPGASTPYSLAGERRAFSLSARAGGGDKDEGGLSFSTNPELYFHGQVFATGTADQVAVHVVKAPRGTVIQNFVSDFKNEYEVVGIHPIIGKHIVKKFDGNEMKKIETFKGDLGNVMQKLIGTTTSNANGEIDLEAISAKALQTVQNKIDAARVKDAKSATDRK